MGGEYKRKPFHRNDNGKLVVVWKNFLVLDNWKVPWRDMLLIIIVLGMTISYTIETRECQVFVSDPCGYMYELKDVCFEPYSCVSPDPFGLNKYNATLDINIT